MTKKLILDIDETTWKEVLKYKIDKDIPVVNDAVVKLIKIGLRLKDWRQTPMSKLQRQITEIIKEGY